MKNWIALVAVASLVTWGCTRSEAPPDGGTSAGAAHDHDAADHDHTDHDHGDHDHGHPDHDAGAHGQAGSAAGDGGALHFVAAEAYCGTCGNAKGSAQCCAEGAQACASCGMTKGSTLCCKLEGDFAGKTLCGKCGEVAGADRCCLTTAERCALCGLNTASPLCCKLPPATAESSPGAENES